MLFNNDNIMSLIIKSLKDNIQISTTYKRPDFLNNKEQDNGIIELDFTSNQILYFVQVVEGIESVFKDNYEIIQRLKSVHDIAVWFHDQTLVDLIADKLISSSISKKINISDAVIIKIIRLQFPEDIKHKINYSTIYGDLTSCFENFNIIGIAAEIGAWDQLYMGPFNYDKRTHFSLPGYQLPAKNMEEQHTKEYISSYILASLDLLDIKRFMEHLIKIGQDLTKFPVWLVPTVNLLLVKDAIKLNTANVNILCLANLAFWTNNESLNLLEESNNIQPISKCLIGNKKYIDMAKVRIMSSANLYERIIEILMFVTEDITKDHKDVYLQDFLKELVTDVTEYQINRVKDKLFSKTATFCTLTLQDSNDITAYNRPLNCDKLVDCVVAHEDSIGTYLTKKIKKTEKKKRVKKSKK
jgi:hypothetical protein